MAARRIQKRVGFAGMGIMGSRMAKNFLTKGFPTTVWNRTQEKCRPLAELGARVAMTPRELAESADVVITCVADPAALSRVVFAIDGILNGAREGFRYIDCSTVSPALSRQIAAAFEERGAAALEAPVTGSKNGAEQGTLLFMTGGRREVHDELSPILEVMGTKAIYCGETGQGAMMKLVNNSIISFILEGLCESFLVGRKAGLSHETMMEVVMASGYSSPYFAFKGGAIGRREFEDVHFTVDLLHKDQTLMLQEAASVRATMPGLVAIREITQAARGMGWGQEDIIAVLKVLERQAGL